MFSLSLILPLTSPPSLLRKAATLRDQNKALEAKLNNAAFSARAKAEEFDAELSVLKAELNKYRTEKYVLSFAVSRSTDFTLCAMTGTK